MSESTEVVQTDPDEKRPYAELMACEIEEEWRCPVEGCHKRFDVVRALRMHAQKSHLIRWEAQTPEKAAKWKALRSYEEMEVSDLRPWHRIAIFRNVVLGSSYAELSRSLNKHEITIQKLCTSNAGMELGQQIAEQLADNESLLRIIIGSSAIGLQLEDMAALEWAKEAEDYEFVHKYFMDYAKMTGMEKQGEGGGQSIVINLDSSSLDVPKVKMSHVPAQPKTFDVDFEIVDDE